MIARQTINWKPFSNKHKKYIANAMKSKMSVAEGSIRSGKTIDHCIIAAAYLEECPDKIHLATGSTIANAKLNIGACNGFGLENLFRGRCRWGKYNDNECLYINTKTGLKILIFAGGGKADSYKKILGNSYGLWIATEINEHYDSDNSRESFIKVALGRQLASLQPKILWDLNPCNPNHKIYKDYIDKYQEEGLMGGYNYQHFTIVDNLSISPERIAEIKNQYDPNSMWYKRDILGIRCRAEGLIYGLFADNSDKYIISRETFESEYKPKVWFTNCGIDFGNNLSSHTFVATAFTHGFENVIVFHTKKIAESITPKKLDQAFNDFITTVFNDIPMAFACCCDNEETTLINGFKMEVYNSGLHFCEVKNALKSKIIDRIRLTCRLFAEGRLLIVDDCEDMISAFQNAVWDDKHEDERLDEVGHFNPVDMLDAFEYSIEEYYQELMMK